ncbi:CRISPR-associated protein Cas4 [Roseibium sp. RKSG952]|nr:CRISPR-associated protein Cas4 [Roseibium sp. RKSG952]
MQHAVYCLRQAALIHLERLWEENRFTAEGDVLHAVADKGGRRWNKGARRVMAVPVGSRRLNLTGVADLVEYLKGEGTQETPFPVEYKRGKPKHHRADEVQLCAQALCLEEMTGAAVPAGALFYAQTKRRVIVPMDRDLRGLTEETVMSLAGILESLQTPPPTDRKSRCRACSLKPLCRPEIAGRSVSAWRSRFLKTALAADDT